MSEERWAAMAGEANELKRNIKKGADPKEAALSFLDALLEDFPEPYRPLQDPEGYAVHRTASTLYEVIWGL
ncbi:MAG: hypothetical protein ACYC5Y_16015 [Symbiobacteriia bacterium]